MSPSPLGRVAASPAVTELHVCKAGCAYTTVQAAIDAAATGDEIRIASGVDSASAACAMSSVGHRRQTQRPKRESDACGASAPTWRTEMDAIMKRSEVMPESCNKRTCTIV